MTRLHEPWFRRMGVVALIALGGCGGGEGGMEDMPGMSSPEGSESQPADASEAMRDQLDRMSSLAGDTLMAALPGHRQMVANMLAQMNREMSSMNMAADVAWNSTVDSIRSDLTSMPSLSAEDLAALLPAHRTRVERLMAMHTAMMGRM